MAMNTLIQLVGHINEAGYLQIDQRIDLPPGDVFVTVEVMTEAMLAEEDRRWEESFARTPHVLDQLLAEGLQSLVDGTADELNPDDMLP